jgi:hypothetical protein
VLIKPIYWKATQKKLLSSCLNPNVYATTQFAFFGIFSVFKGLEHEIDNFMISTIKLGTSIKRFINLDQILMVPVDPNDLYDSHWIGHKVWWDQFENSGWKVCYVPSIDLENQQYHHIRFYQAKLFSKLNAWNFEEYDGIVVIDSDMFCVNNPTEIFTYHFPKMIAQNKSFGAHEDHPKRNHRSLAMIIKGHCHSFDFSEFNAGIILIKPSKKEYTRLVQQMNKDC